jgi:hypothetical protein
MGHATAKSDQKDSGLLDEPRAFIEGSASRTDPRGPPSGPYFLLLNDMAAGHIRSTGIDLAAWGARPIGGRFSGVNAERSCSYATQLARARKYAHHRLGGE